VCVCVCVCTMTMKAWPVYMTRLRVSLSPRIWKYKQMLFICLPYGCDHDCNMFFQPSDTGIRQAVVQGAKQWQIELWSEGQRKAMKGTVHCMHSPVEVAAHNIGVTPSNLSNKKKGL
jgi:hypothetical protein